MAAHATFNGTLVVVAALSLSGPAHAVTGAGVTFTVPGSWRQVSPTSTTPLNTNDVEARSPSGAQVIAQRLQASGQFNASQLIARFNASPVIAPGVTIKGGTVRPVQYPAGGGAAADVDDNGHDAEAVVISAPQGTVVLELVTNGDAKARAQFESMLQSLQVS
jgi:hypothetical protein